MSYYIMAYNSVNSQLSLHDNSVDGLVGISGGALIKPPSPKQLEKYVADLHKFVNEGGKKPTKTALNALENAGVISKLNGAGYSQIGGVNRLKKAKRWTGFVKQDVIKDSVDLADYAYGKYKKATDPVGYAFGQAITGGGKGMKPAVMPRHSQPPSRGAGYNRIGGAKPAGSNYIQFVKQFASQHNIPYKEAMKVASAEYRKMKGAGYSSMS